MSDKVYPTQPVERRGNVVNQGKTAKGICGVDSNGDAETTSDSDFTQFFVPEGEDFNGAVIQVGDPRATSYDPEVTYCGFLWCDVDPDENESAVIKTFDYNGFDAGIAKLGTEDLGWFKSEYDAKSVIVFKNS